MIRAILEGAVRFAIVSVLAFGFWAAEPNILPRGTGEMWTFAGTLIFFLAVAEIFMVPIAHPPNARSKFNRSFMPAFFAYAIVWSLCWFALKFGKGEWLGSVLGCATFALILGRQLGASAGFCKVICFLIATHALGYFLGGRVFYMARHPPEMFAGWRKEDIWTVAKLAWGLVYGLGFGAGIGFAFHVFQNTAHFSPSPHGRGPG